MGLLHNIRMKVLLKKQQIFTKKAQKEEEAATVRKSILTQEEKIAKAKATGKPKQEKKKTLGEHFNKFFGGISNYMKGIAEKDIDNETSSLAPTNKLDTHNNKGLNGLGEYALKDRKMFYGGKNGKEKSR